MDPNVNKKETMNTIVNADEKVVDMVKLHEVIIKQLEFYFGDHNLPFDKFLLNITKTDNGWVKIDVLITFPRLASLSKDPTVIASAVKNAPKSFLEINTSLDKIRRKLHHILPILPADQKLLLSEMIDRSIYCKGFPLTAKMDELLEFAATFGDNIITKITLRKFNNYQFKGSLYLTFNTKEQAELFLKKESVKYKGIELERMWENDFLKLNNKQIQTEHVKQNNN